MITLLKQPYQCSYSKNAMEFEVQSNMYFVAPQVLPSVLLTIDSIPETGVHYIISYTNVKTNKPEELRLVASVSYDGTLEIPDNSYAGTIQEFRDIMVDKIENQCPANAWFMVEAIGTNQLKITTTYTEENIVPEFRTNQTLLHIDFLIDGAFIDPAIREGYQIRALVYIELEYMSGEFSLVSNVEGFMNNEAKYLLDVSYMLDAEIEDAWDEYPMPTEQNSIYKASNLRRYYVEFVEFWNNETDKQSVKSDIRFVHWGGVSTDDENIATPIFLHALENNFLTWWPSGKKVSLEQPDWLSWINQFDKQTFSVSVRIYTDAGTTQVLLHSIELDTWETMVFQTGYTQNDLQALVAGEYINKWEYYIQDAGLKVLSNEFRYYPDRVTCLRRVILYFNSAGVPETFHTSGDWTQRMNVSTEVASRSASFNLNNLRPRSFVFSSNHKNSIKAVTGPLSKKEAFRIQPMINTMISFVQDQLRWRPVVMVTSKSDVLVENDFIRRIELEILEANDSDRASFYDLQPDVNVVESCGIERFTVNDNGIGVTNFEPLDIYQQGVLIDTVNWNAPEQAYVLSSPIIEPGNYRLVVSLDDYDIQKHFDYRRQRIMATTQATGIVGLTFRSANPSETVYIDWGEGYGFQASNYTNANTLIQNSYTKLGKKKIMIEKACFDDVLQFGANDFDLFDIEFSAMKNLEQLAFSNSLEGNIYLSAFQNLTNISLGLQPTYSINIGFQRDLLFISTNAISITSPALDDLFLELWEYRQLYSNQLPGTTPTVNMTFLGFSPSALVGDITNGTGNYIGQGLASDYGWTINLS